MTIFITGGSKSGKSMLAQTLAKQLAGEGELYYLATMEPHDDEDKARIACHVAEREGWGFETLECPRNILSCLDRAEKNGVFLLDSVTALLSNEMFRGDSVRHGAAEKIASELEALAKKALGLIVVCDSICADTGGYGELTEEFRQGLAEISCRMAERADRALEVCAGQAIDLKQGPEQGGECAVKTLIIGGAYQGKTKYAAERFGLEEGDICVCCREREPDFDKRCLVHAENYALRCLLTGVSGQEALEQWFDRHEDAVIIFDDIFCGVVPAERELRAWREAAGRLLAFSAKRAQEILRVSCAIAQRLK